MRGESAASFSATFVAALFTDMFCNFYLVKSHTFALKNSLTTKARVKISTDLESLEFFMYVQLN